MTTAITSATTLAAVARHHATGSAAPRNWALSLAVMALLGLSILGFLGADFSTGVAAAADTARAGAVTAFVGVDAIVAGIRWVR